MVKYDKKYETNPRVERLYYRELNLSCSYCPPNQGENSKRSPRYPVKKAYQLDPKRRHG